MGQGVVNGGAWRLTDLEPVAAVPLCYKTPGVEHVSDYRLSPMARRSKRKSSRERSAIPSAEASDRVKAACAVEYLKSSGAAMESCEVVECDVTLTACRGIDRAYLEKGCTSPSCFDK